MTDYPISFSPAMVRAIQAGRKTQTRRLASPTSRRFKPGDRLWVQEPFSIYGDERAPASYRADHPADRSAQWRQPRHMKRVYSRLLLEVKVFEIRKLLDMTHTDLEAEGVMAAEPVRMTTMNGSPVLQARPSARWPSDRRWGTAISGGLLFPAPIEFWLHTNHNALRDVPAYMTPEEAFTDLWCRLNPSGPFPSDNPEVRVITFELVQSPVVRAALEQAAA